MLCMTQGTRACDYEHRCLLGCDVTSNNILDGPAVYLRTEDGRQYVPLKCGKFLADCTVLHLKRQ